MLKLREYQYREEYTYYLIQALKNDQRDLFRSDFLELQPTDQAEFFSGLDKVKQQNVYRFLTVKEFRVLFQHLSTEKQAQWMRERSRDSCKEDRMGATLCR